MFIKLNYQGFSKIEGLDCLQTLRCLYLQENLIKTIENFNLPELINLNLSDNMIETISGLENCLKLSSLQVKRNRIGVHGISDIEELAKIQSLTSFIFFLYDIFIFCRKIYFNTFIFKHYKNLVLREKNKLKEKSNTTV